MKHTLRLLSLVLVLMMLSSVCLASDGLTSDERGKAPYAETVVITAAMSDETAAVSFLGEGETREKNRWTDLYLDRLNIQVESAWVASEYESKLNLAIASGDLPDAFRCNYTQMCQLAQAGLLADLSEVYADYASDTTKKYLEGYQVGFDSGIVDGKLVGISMQHYGTVTKPYYLYIRNDWLEASGMEVPTTIDELTELARVFMASDFDGNGIDDTYGIAEDSSLSTIIHMMPSFHAYSETWLKDDNGEIRFGGVDASVKTALETYASWYEEGILTTEFAAMNTEQMYADIINDRVGIWVTKHGFAFGCMPDNIITNGPEAIWYPYPMPSVDGEQVYMEMPWQVENYCVVSKDCKNPEAVIKLINVYTGFRNGEETAEDFTYYMDNVHTLSAPFVVNNPFADNQQNKDIKYAIETGDTSIVEADATTYQKYLSCMAWINDKDPNSVCAYLQVSDKGAYTIGNEYIDNGWYIVTALGGQKPDTMIERGSALTSMLNEGFTQIIMGEQPVEYFDELASAWYTAGGQQITDEMNELYGG